MNNRRRGNSPWIAPAPKRLFFYFFHKLWKYSVFLWIEVKRKQGRIVITLIKSVEIRYIGTVLDGFVFLIFPISLRL